MGSFDSFTFAVIVGDVLMVLTFIGLIVIDKKKPLIEAVKPAGKQ